MRRASEDISILPPYAEDSEEWLAGGEAHGAGAYWETRTCGGRWFPTWKCWRTPASRCAMKGQGAVVGKQHAAWKKSVHERLEPKVRSASWDQRLAYGKMELFLPGTGSSSSGGLCVCDDQLAGAPKLGG